MSKKESGNDISSRLTEIMKEKRFKSVRAFALAIDIDPSYFSKVYKNERPISDPMLEGIQKKLGFKTDWLLTGKGDKYRQDGTGSTGNLLPSDSLHTEIIQILKSHNDFLQRMLEANLNSLATTQQIVLAEVKAGLKYGALKDAGGNKKKEAEILAQISRTAGEYLQTFGVKDSASIVDR